MDIISRSDAVLIGAKTYFTGKPCKYGHLDARSVSGRHCVECGRIAARPRAKAWAAANSERYKTNQARWREENKDSERERSKAHREANKEHYAQYERERRGAENRREYHTERYRTDPEFVARKKAVSKKWREANPELYAASCKKWRSENAPRIRENAKKWSAKNPQLAKAIRTASVRTRQTRMHNAGKMSVQDVKELHATKVCAACGKTHPRMEIDHIRALSRGGTNHRSNLQLLCQPCNRRKHNKEYYAWKADTLNQLTE